MKFTIYPLGDLAIIIEFHSTETYTSQECVQRAYQILSPCSCYETVPAYHTLTVHFDNTCFSKNRSLIDMSNEITNLLKQSPPLTTYNQKCVLIPVCYESPFSPDIGDVASFNQLTELEVIEIHTSGVYQVSFIGFAPGFPFLKGLSPLIHAPRKINPRVSVAQGSVGIAGNQTGIYSFESPGGWQIIGRTPIQLFSLTREPPSLLSPGDWVKFYSISKQQYDEWG